MQTARKIQGSDWGQIVFRAALWYSPVPPTPTATPPTDVTSLSNYPNHTKKVTFREYSHKLHAELCCIDADWGFLNTEIFLPGEGTTSDRN